MSQKDDNPDVSRDDPGTSPSREPEREPSSDPAFFDGTTPQDASPADIASPGQGATRRGSYKMPGGKLVNATVVIGPPPRYRIVSVRFDGDYSVDVAGAESAAVGTVGSADGLADSENSPAGTDNAADLSLRFLGQALQGIAVRDQSHRLHLHVVAEFEERIAAALAAHPQVAVSGMDAHGFAIAVFHAISGQSTEEGTSTVAPSTASGDHTNRADTADQNGRSTGDHGKSGINSGISPAHRAPHILLTPRQIAARWADAGVGLVDPQDTLEHPYSPAMQMALDEVISRRTAAGKLPPLLRFWQWARPAVILGRFQSLSHEVDLGQARLAHVDVVRRETGGGAMFVEPGNTITYSLTVSLSFAAGLDAENTYVACESWAIDALRSLGIDARHAPLNDISSPAGKIGGAAERRYPALADSHTTPGALLHHTTMAYDIDAAKMNRILTPNKTKLAAHAVKSAAKRVDPLRSQSGLSREEIIRAMAAWLVENVPGIVPGYIPDDVVDEARALAKSKYEDPAWTGIIE